MALTTETDPQTLALLRSLVTAFEDKKAENLTVLRVSAQSNITDFLVLATGNSEPHLRALRVEAEKVLDAAKVIIAGMDQGGYGSGWTVVDAYQIMIHFFTAEQRENYALEKLWRDAEVIDLKAMDAKPRVSVKGKTGAEPLAPSKGVAKAKGLKKKPVAKSAKVAKVAQAANPTAKAAKVRLKPAVKAAKPAAKKAVAKPAAKPVAKKWAK
jgi:ribosome-associated protein